MAQPRNTIVLVLLYLCVAAVRPQDPCENYTYLNDDGSRSINCYGYFKKSQDRFIDEGWRRVRNTITNTDLKMPTSCVPHGQCGSHSGIWLNGSHPTVDEGIVDRTGCLSMFSSCCHTQYSIQIKNCSSFMVYNLKRTLGSDTRYCFGDSVGCPTTTTPQPSTTIVHVDISSTTPQDSERDERRRRGRYDDAYGNNDRDDNGGNDMKIVTIVLSVVISGLIIALIVTLLVMKLKYKPIKRSESQIKTLYESGVDEPNSKQYNINTYDNLNETTKGEN